MSSHWSTGYWIVNNVQTLDMHSALFKQTRLLKSRFYRVHLVSIFNSIMQGWNCHHKKNKCRKQYFAFKVSPVPSVGTHRWDKTYWQLIKHSTDTTNIVNRMYNKRSRIFTNESQQIFMVRLSFDESEHILSTRNSTRTGLQQSASFGLTHIDDILTIESS